MTLQSPSALIASVHHEALERLSIVAKAPLMGLSQGARVLQLPSRWQHKLRALDVALAYMRHAIAQRNRYFIEGLEAVPGEATARRAMASAQTDISVPSHAQVCVRMGVWDYGSVPWLLGSLSADAPHTSPL